MYLIWGNEIVSYRNTHSPWSNLAVIVQNSFSKSRVNTSKEVKEYYEVPWGNDLRDPLTKIFSFLWATTYSLPLCHTAFVLLITPFPLPSIHLPTSPAIETLDNELLCAHTLLSKDLRENLQTKIQLIHGDLKHLKQPFVCFTSYKQKLHGYIQLNMSQSPCSTSSIGYIQNDKAKMATVGYPKTEKFHLVLKKIDINLSAIQLLFKHFYQIKNHLQCSIIG